jgi:hypothetical protein
VISLWNRGGRRGDQAMAPRLLRGWCAETKLIKVRTDPLPDQIRRGNIRRGSDRHHVTWSRAKEDN